MRTPAAQRKQRCSKLSDDLAVRVERVEDVEVAGRTAGNGGCLARALPIDPAQVNQGNEALRRGEAEARGDLPLGAGVGVLRRRLRT